MPALHTIPRRDRDLHRGRIAADKVRAAGGTAMDAALTHVAVAYDCTAQHNRLKASVARYLTTLGASDFEVRARFGRRALMIVDAFGPECSLSAAIRRVEVWYLIEKIAYARTIYSAPVNLSMAASREARLALRWLRRYRPEAWPRVLAELTAPAVVHAAKRGSV